MKYSEQLIAFLEQAKTGGLKTRQYQKNFTDITVKVSFGQGTPARVPWISFLKEPFTTSDGIYPVYLFYKKQNILILAYGISETNKPRINWIVENPKSIDEYFKENNLGIPYRYGESYIFKVYNANHLPNSDILDNDLNQIINFYLDIMVDEKAAITDELDPIKSNDNIPLDMHESEAIVYDDNIEFSIDEFENSLSEAGLIFSKKLLTRFTASLATKPFVLLTGLSGSGKTKLAQAFAQWICESKEQYCIVPVGADWINREPLLGYVNALDNRQYILPENGALKLIIRANNDKKKPYFLVLDEMNLSHVERYFADFLSVMESKDKIKLHSAKENLNNKENNKVNDDFIDAIEVPSQLACPENIFEVGTVNIDETTYMFSPKVLDRANVIEFRITSKELSNYFDKNSSQLDMKKLCEDDSDIGKGSKYGESFVTIANSKEAPTDATQLNDELIKYFEKLQEIGAEFGYRSASEIQILFKKLDDIDISYSSRSKEKIDIAIMQKLLPKLHGSRSKLVDVLFVLASFCYDKDEFSVEELKKIFEKPVKFDAKIKYPISLEKINRMYRNVIDNGFTSYAEA